MKWKNLNQIIPLDPGNDHVLQDGPRLVAGLIPAKQTFCKNLLRNE